MSLRKRPYQLNGFDRSSSQEKDNTLGRSLSKSGLNFSSPTKLKQYDDIFKRTKLIETDLGQRSSSATRNSSNLAKTIAVQPQLSSPYSKSFNCEKINEPQVPDSSANRRSTTPFSNQIMSNASSDTFLKSRVAELFATRQSANERDRGHSVGSRLKNLLNTDSPGLKFNSLGLNSITDSGKKRYELTPHKNSNGTRTSDFSQKLIKEATSNNMGLELGLCIDRIENSKSPLGKRPNVSTYLEKDKTNFRNQITSEKSTVNGSRSKIFGNASRFLDLRNEISRKVLLSPKESEDKKPSNDKERVGYFLNSRLGIRAGTEKKGISEYKSSFGLHTSESKITTEVSATTEENKHSNGLFDLIKKLNKSREEMKANLRGDKPKNPVRATSYLTSSLVNTKNQSEQEEEIGTDSSADKHHSWKNKLKNNPVAEIVSVNKLYELQDVFTDVPDQEFNKLPTSYIDEMVKLSSIIMHRVKSSNYYSTKTD